MSRIGLQAKEKQSQNDKGLEPDTPTKQQQLTMNTPKQGMNFARHQTGSLVLTHSRMFTGACGSLYYYSHQTYQFSNFSLQTLPCSYTFVTLTTPTHQGAFMHAGVSAADRRPSRLGKIRGASLHARLFQGLLQRPLRWP